MSSTLEASVFMGKNNSDNLHSIKNTEDLAMKQMFDISEKSITEQSDEIYEVNTINWCDHHCQRQSCTRSSSDREGNRGVLQFISQERIFVCNVEQIIDVHLLHREGLPSCAFALQSGTVRARAHASDR